MRQSKGQKWMQSILIVIMLIIALVPIYWMINTSFKTNAEIYQRSPTFYPNNITTESYDRLLNRTPFLNGLKNSLIIGIAVSVFSILVSFPTAYTLARTKFKGKNVFSRLILFTYLLPTSIMYIPLYLLVSELGLTNNIWGLVLIYPTFTLPYCAWVLIPHIQSIPYSIEEAAQIDGASRFTTMFKIIFPMSMPGIISTTIFTFAMCWGEYLYALVNITSTSEKTFPIIISELIFGDMIPWGQIMAGGVISVIPILIIYFLANSSLVGGATEGGVKM